MNRINPLYIGAFLVIILMAIAFKLVDARAELATAKEAYKETAKLSTELSSLKKIYASNKLSRKKILLKILQLSSLKSANIEKINKKSTTVLSSQSMDKTALNTLMGKLLNASFNLTNIKIKKLSQDKATLYLEIKW